MHGGSAVPWASFCFPYSIAWMLEDMRSLYLVGQKFNGTLPSQLGQLTGMKTVTIHLLEYEMTKAHSGAVMPRLKLKNER